MEMFFVMAIFFVFVTLIFLILCFFFPEWVGITGKKALEVIEHQKESGSPQPSTPADLTSENRSDNNSPKS